MKRKQISILLLLSILLSNASMTACGGGTETTGEITATSENVAGETVTETTEPKDSLEARLDVSDALPEANFNGNTFTICGDDACTAYYTSEEETGETVNDSIFRRNMTVEERYNVKIAANVFPENDIMPAAQNSVLAADDAYQLIACHVINLGSYAADDMLYNWYDLPHVDFSKPWWSPSTTNDLTYKGTALIAIGDFAMSSIDSTYCMYYNKELAETHNLPDIYDIVNDGKWTIDQLNTLCANVYVDTDGDGTKNVGDTFGLMTDATSCFMTFLWAFDKKVAIQQKDGSFEINYYDEKLVSIVEKLYALYYEADFTYFKPSSFYPSYADIFTSGTSLFATSQFKDAIGAYRDAEFDYGIIPYPKWDEAQKNYYTSVDGGHEGLAIPKSITDTAYIGIMTEVLNAESWKQTTPAYYDTALKFKGARDEESIAMIDLIMESRVFDFGYVYGGWSCCAFWPMYVIWDKSTDIASYHEANNASFQEYMNSLFTTFDEISAS